MIENDIKTIKSFEKCRAGAWPLLAGTLLGGGLLALLSTPYYMYYFYAVLGMGLYLLSHSLGKALYVVLFFLRILIASPLTELFFNVSSENLDGLNPLKVNIWCLCWLVVFCFELLEWLLRERVALDGLVALALVVMAGFGAVTLLRRATSGMGLLLESYVGPITLFLVFYLRRDISYARLRRYMAGLLALIVLSAGGAVLEYAAGGTAMESYFLRHGQEQQAGDAYRAMGLVGQIMLPTLMLVGCMLTNRLVQKMWLRFALYTALMAAAALSKTRFMLVLIVAYVLAAELLRAARGARRFGSLRTLSFRSGLVLLGCGGAVLVLLATPAGRSVLLRISADNGSINARMLQIDYLLENFLRLSLYGLGGFADNVALINEYGQASIPEIPWINLYFEVGPLLLVALCWLLYRVIRAGNMGLELAALLISFTPYNSFSTKSASFSVFFLMAVFGVVSKRHQEAKGEAAIPRPNSRPLAAIGAKRALRMAALSVLFAALCFGFGGLVMSRRYEAQAELYIWAGAPAADDTLIAPGDLESAARLNKAITDDLVLLGAAPAVLQGAAARVESQGFTLQAGWEEKLALENADLGRVLKITYEDTDPNRAAAVVNALAEALAAQSRSLDGGSAIQALAQAQPQPAEAFRQPRLGAVAVTGGLLMLFAQAGGLLLGRHARPFARFFVRRMGRAFAR